MIILTDEDFFTLPIGSKIMNQNNLTAIFLGAKKHPTMRHAIIWVSTLNSKNTWSDPYVTLSDREWGLVK